MSEKQPKKKKTAGDVVLTVVLIAAICVFCYAGYNLFHIYTEYKKGTDEYNSITQMAVTERDPDGEAAGPEAGSELKAPMDIDFASLKSVNDDVVGWIYVEAVPDINYPIVHGKDNETYLHRTYEKNYNFAGTIFVDYENKGDFSDCNTIVYGHNMKNGSMFGSIHSFEDETFFDGHPYIYVYTENERLTYEIYEAAKFTDVYIPSEYVISSKDDRDQFLADVREKVSDNKLHVREDMEIGEDDRLITLSTCVSGERNHRYLVIGVLVETALYR